MTWTYEESEVIELPLNVYGFIYLLTYENGTKYIGKKQCVKEVKLPALKSGEVRPNAKRTYKNGSGKRVYIDVLQKEMDWRNYEGSHDKPESPLVSKKILEYAPTKRSLTYLEAKHLFINSVLEDDTYLNQNILGSFFKGKLL
jgi:hypothetical protein